MPHGRPARNEQRGGLCRLARSGSTTRTRASDSSPRMTAPTCSCTRTRCPRVTTALKTGARVEFGIVEGRRGAQALPFASSTRPRRSWPPAGRPTRKPADEMVVIVEDVIKLLDKRRQRPAHAGTSRPKKLGSTSPARCEASRTSWRRDRGRHANALDADAAAGRRRPRPRRARRARGARQVGDHLGMEPLEERLAMHWFACLSPGYRGWRWGVTVARVPRGKVATVSETNLLPGPDALLAPEWLPYADRLAPGDLGAGDVLPFRATDPYLEAGFEATGDEDVDQMALLRARSRPPAGAVRRGPRGRRQPLVRRRARPHLRRRGQGDGALLDVRLLPADGRRPARDLRRMRQRVVPLGRPGRLASTTAVGRTPRPTSTSPTPTPLGEPIVDEFAVDLEPSSRAEAAGSRRSRADMPRVVAPETARRGRPAGQTCPSRRRPTRSSTGRTTRSPTERTGPRGGIRRGVRRPGACSGGVARRCRVRGAGTPTHPPSTRPATQPTATSRGRPRAGRARRASRRAPHPAPRARPRRSAASARAAAPDAVDGIPRAGGSGRASSVTLHSLDSRPGRLARPRTRRH